MADNSQATYALLWWAFTIVLAALILAPIYTQLPYFPFYLPNFIYVLVAVTLTRYLFFLNISWLRNRLAVQGGLSLLLIPVIFWMVQNFNAFIIFFDENGPDVLVKSLAPETARIMDSYLHAEYRFFGIWAIIAALVTPFRLLYNVWMRYRAGVRTW
ncbi:MAG: hypothetical protein AAFN92_07035 [Bacteroidota bacterium]